MATTPTLYASGTKTASVSLTVDDVLSSPNVAGVFTLHLDTNAMAALDVLEVRVYQIILTAGTKRMLWLARYTGAQPTDDLIKDSEPIGNDLTDTNSLQFAIRQTFGTGRAYPWKILQY